jgi:methylmalonyl-CoA mutase N-terminal domain/subunit
VDNQNRNQTIAEQAGEFPFTRGIHPTMYQGRLWTMRQYSGFGTAEETNERFRYLLSQGVTGLSTAFDLPTQMGIDSDDERALGEVGRVGVAIDSLEDMDRLFQDIPLEEVSVSMTINATAHILLALYLALAKKRGLSWKKLNGTVQNDILKEYIARGTYIYPPKGGIKLVTDIIEFCSNEVPQWNTISISGYHIREAGSTAVQELAFTFGNAIAYVEAALKRGLSFDSFAPRLAFFFNCHNNFLEEIAKFRAARRIWATLARDLFKAKEKRSMLLRFHTQTAGSTLTAQQPEVNIVRTTIQAMAAVLGGTQSLHTNSFDEALGLPTERAALLALRTQQVIAHESGIAQAIDPFGGSYLIEELTNHIEHEVLKYLNEIENKGGMVQAIEGHFPQEEIERAAYDYQREIEREERLIIGVNSFKSANDSTEVNVLKVNPALEEEQRARVKLLKQNRDATKAKECLDKVGEHAKADQNIVPAVIDAVNADVTLGEISDLLREVFGEYED